MIGLSDICHRDLSFVHNNIPGDSLQLESRWSTTGTSLHGGVALSVKDCIKCKLRWDLCFTTEWCESLFVEIPLIYTLYVVYHIKPKYACGCNIEMLTKPEGRFLSSTTNVLEHVTNETNIFITGDLKIYTSAITT